MKKKYILSITILIFLMVIVFSRVSSDFNFEFKSNELSEIINRNLSTNNGQYAVYIESLVDRESYSVNDQAIFPAASLYKVFLLAAALKEIEDGKLKLEDRLTSSKISLVERYGGVDSGYEEWSETIEYSVEEAMTRIGRISDNFAAIMLSDKIGWDKYSPTTTAWEIGLFFKKLYQKEIVSEKVSDEIVKYLSLNQINNRIPAGVPDGVRVIHKTGELARVRHDAGIVYLTNESYIIVLMSKDLQYEDEAVETFAKISKEVYDYFKGP